VRRTYGCLNYRPSVVEPRPNVKPMSHLTTELKELKSQLLQMGKLVQQQLDNGQEALLHLNRERAEQVILNEKRVNSLELAIDSKGAAILALYAPVAVDLRLVLAVLSISVNLERISDAAESLARFTLEAEKPFDQDLIRQVGLENMFETAREMLEDVLNAFATEDAPMARKVMKKDKKLNKLNEAAPQVMSLYLRQNPELSRQSLTVFSSIYKLERVGDHCTNIGEEIVYYVKAKTLKHRKKKLRKKDL
jgi:phosphate transport system protein